MGTIYDEICDSVKGMSSPAVLERLNYYVHRCKPGEYYLEIGTCHGRTLIGAMVGHDIPGIAVDNFSEFQNEMWCPSKKALLANLKLWDVEQRVTFHEMDFDNFFNDYKEMPPLGVFFYDGPHEFAPQLRGMYRGFESVVKGGYLIVDDIGFFDVARACREFERNSPVRIVENHPSHPLPGQAYDPIWWNGLIIYERIG